MIWPYSKRKDGFEMHIGTNHLVISFWLICYWKLYWKTRQLLLLPFCPTVISFIERYISATLITRRDRIAKMLVMAKAKWPKFYSVESYMRELKIMKLQLILSSRVLSILNLVGILTEAFGFLSCSVNYMGWLLSKVLRHQFIVYLSQSICLQRRACQEIVGIKWADDKHQIPTVGVNYVMED